MRDLGVQEAEGRTESRTETDGAWVAGRQLLSVEEEGRICQGVLISWGEGTFAGAQGPTVHSHILSLSQVQTGGKKHWFLLLPTL